MRLINFLCINVGQPGRNGDGSIFSLCSFGRNLRHNTLNLLDDIPFHSRATPVPYCVIADDAFPLLRNIMKPYSFKSQSISERVFNYRLSRARRVVENAFGIIACLLRVLHKPLEVQPKIAIPIICSICVLHNFLLSRSGKLYTPKRLSII